MADNIGGFTLHSYFGLQYVNRQGVAINGGEGEENWVKKRTRMNVLKFIFIDEIENSGAELPGQAEEQTRRNTKRQNAPRRPFPERELIYRTTIATPVSTRATTSTAAITTACPKCGTFKKFGRLSCCAPGGTWFKNCGYAVNEHVHHRWFEGVDACKCKFKANDS